MSDIFLEVNGIRYSGFTGAEVSRNMEDFGGKFTFSSTVKETTALVIQNDLRVQDAIKIYIDDNIVMNGYIEELEISYSTSSHQIVVSGRDRTGDLIDSSIIKNQYSQTNFIKLAEIVLKQNGYSDIKIINGIDSLPILTPGASSDPESLDGDKIVTEEGETIAAFLDRYARQVQVLLLTNENGDLQITNEGSQVMKGDLISAGNQANILSASIKISTIDRFRTIQVYSGGKNDDFTVQSIDQIGTATDNEIRNPRRKIITVPTSSQVNSLSKLAQWNVNIRRAKDTMYTCQVQGFYNTRAGKELWRINTLVQIKDERCQIDGQFLIKGVTYRKDLNGSFTELSIVEKGAFSAEPQVSKSSSTGNSFGENLIDKLSEGII